MSLCARAGEMYPIALTLGPPEGPPEAGVMPPGDGSEPVSAPGGTRAFIVFGEHRSTFSGSGARRQRVHRALDQAIHDTVPRNCFVVGLGLELGHPWGIMGHLNHGN